MTEQLYQIVRKWLRSKKNLSRFIDVYAKEYGPPYAEIVTLPDKDVWAYIDDRQVKFFRYQLGVVEDPREFNHAVDRIANREEAVILIDACDPEFFKKLKQEIVARLHGRSRSSGFFT